MSVEILTSIKETEMEAEEIRKNSIAESRRIIVEAKERASEMVEQEQRNAESEVLEMLQQAEKDAAAEKAEVLHQVEQECEEIKEKARKNMGKAVEIILGRIVKAHGHR